MRTVILFRGQSGTGKTALSDALAARLRLTVLHKDDIYDPAAVHLAEHDARNAISFEVLYRFLACQLRAGVDVIVDYGFNHVDAARSFRQWVEERGGTLRSIRCVCSDEEEWAARLAARRANPLPNQRITDLAELKAHYTDADPGPMEDELVVDTAVMPVDMAVEMILHDLEGAVPQ